MVITSLSSRCGSIRESRAGCEDKWENQRNMYGHLKTKTYALVVLTTVVGRLTQGWF